MFNIDMYEGINRAERTQTAIAHLLFEINNKLDKLMPVEIVSHETIEEVIVEKPKKKTKKKEVK